MTSVIPHYPAAVRYAPIRAALTRFVEETAEAQRDATLAPLERETARSVGQWLVAQGKAVVAALAPIIGPRLVAGVPSALNVADWNYLIAQVMRRPYGGASQLADVLGGAHRRGYLAGSNVTRAQLGGNNPAFFTGNEDAAAYARRHAAARVTRIDETTRAELNRLITDAVERRLSWRETAALIEERYADMAGPPLFPSRTHRRRAQMIAAFECRDAYEAGGYEQARRLAQDGYDVETRWVYLRDGKTRPAHRANGDAGWVPLGHVFADGSTRPPSDGGCRCVLLYRVRPGSAPVDTAAAARIDPVMSLRSLQALIGRLAGGEGQ